MAENSPRPLPQGTPRGLTVLDACGPTSLTAAGTSSVRTSALGRLHYDRFMYAAAVSQTNVFETSSAPAIPAQLRRPGTAAFGAAAGRDYAACDWGRSRAGEAGQRKGIRGGDMCESAPLPESCLRVSGGSFVRAGDADPLTGTLRVRLDAPTALGGALASSEGTRFGGLTPTHDPGKWSTMLHSSRDRSGASAARRSSCVHL